MYLEYLICFTRFAFLTRFAFQFTLAVLADVQGMTPPTKLLIGAVASTNATVVPPDRSYQVGVTWYCAIRNAGEIRMCSEVRTRNK